MSFGAVDGIIAVLRSMVVEGSGVGSPDMAMSRAQRYMSSADEVSFLKLSQSAYANAAERR